MGRNNTTTSRLKRTCETLEHSLQSVLRAANLPFQQAVSLASFGLDSVRSTKYNTYSTETLAVDPDVAMSVNKTKQTQAQKTRGIVSHVADNEQVIIVRHPRTMSITVMVRSAKQGMLRWR